MKTNSQFWDKIAPKYAKKPVPDEEVYRLKLKLTREYFKPGSRVFEYGCGTGTTAIHHAPYVEHVDATDVSEEMLRIGRDKAERANINNVTFAHWDVSRDPVPDQRFDAVMGHSILHLVEDVPAVLEKTRDLLTDGGIFVSSTICIADKKAFLKPVVALMQLLGKAPFVQFLTTGQLETQIQDAGFQIVHHWHPKGSDAVFLIAQKI
jgi:ubiquinone/menaquinone biosynthesis C-methylase UbiE